MPGARDQVSLVPGAAAQAMVDARQAGDHREAIGNGFRPGDVLMNLLCHKASIAGSGGSRSTDRPPLDGAAYFPKWAGSAFVNPELGPWLGARNETNAPVTATVKDGLARPNAFSCVSAQCAIWPRRCRPSFPSRL